jgi:hypothetical protein
MTIKYPNHEYPRHNHMTRDIKEPGKCPGCDVTNHNDWWYEKEVAKEQYHWREDLREHAHTGNWQTCELCWAGDGDPRCQRCGCSAGWPGCQCAPQLFLSGPCMKDMTYES